MVILPPPPPLPPLNIALATFTLPFLSGREGRAAFIGPAGQLYLTRIHISCFGQRDQWALARKVELSGGRKEAFPAMSDRARERERAFACVFRAIFRKKYGACTAEERVENAENASEKAISGRTAEMMKH